MIRDELTDLRTFVLITKEMSFSKAAVRTGLSQSALSHAINRLESRIGVRLLNRTTRSVAPTEAGIQLLDTLIPALGSIENELARLSVMRDTPAGLLRITAPKHAVDTVLPEVLEDIIRNYPDITLEIDQARTTRNIIMDQFDAGIWIGEQVNRDMIGFPVTKPMKMVVVGSSDYLKKNSAPLNPSDLNRHNCISYRRESTGRVYDWELESNGKKLKFTPKGNLIINDSFAYLDLIIKGYGLGCVPDGYVKNHIADGTLKYVLLEWQQDFPGYYLYYSSRKEMISTLRIFIDTVKKYNKIHVK